MARLTCGWPPVLVQGMSTTNGPRGIPASWHLHSTMTAGNRPLETAIGGQRDLQSQLVYGLHPLYAS
jgi:hypothetical protein